MPHHGGPSQGWKRRAERAEEALRDAERRNAGLAERAEKTDATLREAWHYNAGLQLRCDSYREEFAKLAAENSALVEQVAALRASPLVVKCPREPMPDVRGGGTFHPRIGDKLTGLSPHLTCNVYPDAGVTDRSQLRIGELWIKLDDKDANELGGGTADAMATMFSIAVQCGVPVELLAGKLVAIRGGPFGPVWKDYGNGLEPDREVDHCLSLLDYIGKWLLVHFCGYSPFVRTVE